MTWKSKEDIIPDGMIEYAYLYANVQWYYATIEAKFKKSTKAKIDVDD